MKLKDIILNEQYKGIIPRPSVEEYEALKENIKAEGIKISLVINSKNDLLDGYTRYQIAEEIQLSEVPVEIKVFDSVKEEKNYIISLNLNRRHLNTAQRCEIGLMLLETERLKADKRMKAGRKNPRLNSEQGKAIEIAANKVGIGKDTLSKAKKIKEIAVNDEYIANKWKEALQGVISVNQVHEIAKLQINEKDEQLFNAFLKVSARQLGFNLPEGIKFTSKGKIVTDGDITEDEYLEVLKFIIAFEKSIHWWIGDFCNYGKERAKDTTDSEHEKWKSKVKKYKKRPRQVP